MFPKHHPQRSSLRVKQRVSDKFRVHISEFTRKRIRESALPDSLRIARQFFPSLRELKDHPDHTLDPLREEDQDIHPLPYLIHKYPSKLLVLAADVCPVYCRYCTRKRKTMLINGAHESLNPGKHTHLKNIKKYIRRHSRINEVIFSGGDPFMLSDKKIFFLSETILKEKSITFLRYHTRAVTSIPRRFSENFFDSLASIKTRYPQKPISFVFHINHPAELSEESLKIFDKLHQTGCHLFSQSVLLRRVNDDADVLSCLFRELMKNHIHPYYLHQLDAVEGASHFHVPIKTGIQIMDELKRILPPYMIPRYVQDSKKGKKTIR